MVSMFRIRSCRQPAWSRIGTTSLVGMVTWIACAGGVSEDPLAKGRGSSGGGSGTTSSSGGSGSGSETTSGGSHVGSTSGGSSNGSPGGAAGDLSGAGSSGRRDAGLGSDASVRGEDGAGGDSAGGDGAGGESGATAPAGQSGAAGEAGASAGGAGGAGTRRIACSRDTPFGAPVRVPGLPSRAVRLRLSPDERVGYYALWSAGRDYDILVATRETRSDPFGTGEPLSINDPAWDFSATLARNGSALYFESNRSGFWRLYQSHWDPEVDAFGAAVASGLSEATATHQDGAPSVTPDGGAIYFHTTREMGESRLAMARRTEAGFGAVRILHFGALSAQTFPVIAADELTLYFAVNESTGDSFQTDIWSATRTSTSQEFGNFREVAELNTTAHEIPSFISEDGCRLYFDRNTGHPFGWGKADDSAYVAERQPTE